MRPDWILTRYGGALSFRYHAGARGRRDGAFDSGRVDIGPGWFVAAPDLGGYELSHGRERFEVPPGMVAVVPEGVRFRMVGRAPMTQHWVTVSYRLFEVVDVLALAPPLRRLAGPTAAAAAACVRELIPAAGACHRLDLAALARRDGLGLRLLGLLIQGVEPPPGLEQRLQAIVRVQPALRLMEERLAQPLGRGTLARALGLSEGRFHTVFTAAMGVAPYAYLARLRLRRAQDLLLSTDEPVQRVAEAVGHGDAFHFSRSFKRAFGVSPSGFRDRARSL